MLTLKKKCSSYMPVSMEGRLCNNIDSKRLQNRIILSIQILKNLKPQYQLQFKETYGSKDSQVSLAISVLKTVISFFQMQMEVANPRLLNFQSYIVLFIKSHLPFNQVNNQVVHKSSAEMQNLRILMSNLSSRKQKQEVFDDFS